MTKSNQAKEIVSLIGGENNIIKAFNCMTRVRFILKDKTKVQEDVLKTKDYILGVNDAGEQYQLILGPGHAQKVATEINSLYNFNENKESDDISFEQTVQENKKKYKKQNPVGDFLKKIGEIFIPMIPGFIASGIFLGIANILGNLNPDVEQKIALYYYFQILGLSLYSYLAIFTGINTAKVFGGTEILGGIIGGITVSTNLTPLFIALGLNGLADTMPGKGGIFGVLFAVLFMSFIEKKLRKIVPGVLDLIVTPILTLIITSIVTIFGFMLFAGILTDIIDVILNTLVNTNGIVSVISGGLIAGMFLPLVTFGLHQGFTPIYINEITTQGATYIFPIAAMAGAGQVGAAISIYFQAKKAGDTRMTKIISGAIIPGVLGVGEPLIYGVTLPLGKPFITAGLGAAVGGGFVALMRVGAVATGPSGLTALPLILPDKMIAYLLGILISYIFGFIFTKIFFNYETRIKE